MLTPTELQNKIYNTSYDYRDNAMNEFMRDIQENYEQLYSKCVDFNSRIEQLNSSLQYYKSIENTLQNALFLAEKVSEEKLEEASQKAESIESDALSKAEDIVAQAKKQLTDINDKIAGLQVEYEKYMNQYKNLVKGQLDLLDKEPFSLEEAVNKNSSDKKDLKKKNKREVNNFHFDSEIKKEDKKNEVMQDFMSDNITELKADIIPEVKFEMESTTVENIENLVKQENEDTLNINFEPSNSTINNNSFVSENNNDLTEVDNSSNDEIAKFIENATVSMEEMVNSIDDANKELSIAGDGLQNITHDLENTAEILIGEEYFKTYESGQDNAQTASDIEQKLSEVVDSSTIDYDVNNTNIENETNNTEYTNFNNANYSQGFNSMYQQQYNPQYNQNFKQYEYEQPQYEPEEQNTSGGGFFKRRKK